LLLIVDLSVKSAGLQGHDPIIRRLIVSIVVDSSFREDPTVDTGPSLRVILRVGKLPAFNPQAAPAVVNLVNRIFSIL